MTATAPTVMPLSRIISTSVGRFALIPSNAVGSIASAMDTPTINARVSFQVTVDSVLIPDATTMPNKAIPAPPNTGCGIPVAISPTFGSRPRTMRMRPAAVTT